MNIKAIPFERQWYSCPHCGAHLLIYDNTAYSSGVFLKCKKCGSEVEIKIKNRK
nr:MAG TPA: hypothetical protein [Caudoviricetes sp.]